MAAPRHDIVVRFGKRLRELRLERGLSQATLAERAEVTPEYVSRIERGQVGPSMDVIGRLAQALSLDPRSLFEPGAGPRTADPAIARLLDLVKNGTKEQRQLILRLAETVVHYRPKRRRRSPPER